MDPNQKEPKKFNVLVFDGNPLHNWCELFKGRTLADGSEIYVVQASWNDVRVTHYPDKGCLVTTAPAHESNGLVRKPQLLTFTPHFLLVRNQIRGPTPVTDNRNAFYGLLLSNIPAINSLESCLMDLERSAMVGQLKAIEKRVGHERFPLVPITYYDRPEGMAVFDGAFPCVLKVSHAHAGQGKAKVPDMDGFQDVRTILNLTQDYCTAEPYIPTAYGIRVQKVGNNYRVYKKVHTGAGWKSHFGGADLQFMELTDTFKFWVDECAKCYGGMELLAVDAVCDHEGNYHILELNGSAIGIHANFWVEDSLGIVDMAIHKMNAVYCEQQTESASGPVTGSAQEWIAMNEQRKQTLMQLKLAAAAPPLTAMKEEQERCKSSTWLVVGGLAVGLLVGATLSQFFLNSKEFPKL